MKNRTRHRLTDRAAARVVRTARLNSRLSQEALAELAGLHRTYISLLERGHRSPSLFTLEAIAHALNMTPATLLSLIAEAVKESDGNPVPSRSQTTSFHEEYDDASAPRTD